MKLNSPKSSETKNSQQTSQIQSEVLNVTDKLFEVLSPEGKKQVEKTRNKILEKLKSKHQQINLNLSSLKNLPEEKQGELLEKVNEYGERIIELMDGTEIHFERLDTIEEIFENIQKNLNGKTIEKIDGKFDWEDAKKECEKKGGRLPDILELRALFELKCILEVFGNSKDLSLESYRYWSSTEYSTNNVRILYMSSGSSNIYYKITTSYVVCVYGG